VPKHVRSAASVSACALAFLCSAAYYLESLSLSVSLCLSLSERERDDGVFVLAADCACTHTQDCCIRPGLEHASSSW
jgi:hypothetical protein